MNTEMLAPLIRTSKQRWQTLAAFGAAILLHLAAVAVAKNAPAESAGTPIEDSGILVDIAPADQPAQVSPEVDPPAASSMPTDEATFVEPVTPPPRPRLPQRSERLVRPTSSTAPRRGTIGTTRVNALSAPRPEYPYEARRQHLTGSGVATLSIDPATGSVTEVTMSRSTGSAVLDSATMSGFRRWRFKPGTVARVQTPITYTLTGASY